MEEIIPASNRILDTVPLVVDESQINQFRFYFCNAIRVGMHYNQEFYGLIREVDVQARLDAYRLGCELLLQGLPILMTASKSRYALWISLRHSVENHHQFLK